MIDNNAFYKHQEHRAQSGYKAAILVKEQNQAKYSLLVASETVPSVFGSQGSFEFNLLNSPVKGRVPDKIELDDKEVAVLHHRDNAYRFQKLKDKTLDFMYVDSQFVGYKFCGTLTYRVNDAEADVLRGTYTITPMSADPNPYFDVRDEVEETLCFADVIPETIKSTDKINLTLAQAPASVTYTAIAIKGNGEEDTTNSVSVDATKPAETTVTVTKSGLIAITARAEGYAPWTTTVYVEYISA